jgi:hypothetical protein
MMVQRDSKLAQEIISRVCVELKAYKAYKVSLYLID